MVPGLGEGGANGGNDAGTAVAGSGGAAAGAGSVPPASDGGNAGGAPPLGGQAAEKSWRDTLPDDIKSDPTLSKYSDVGNLAKAHVELQKKFGQKGVFKPAANASPEEVKAFREALGIPTDPTKYDMGKFEGVEVTPETLAWAQKMGADHGIEPSAMKTLMTEYMKVEKGNETALEKAAQEDMKVALAELKTEWGDAYDGNIQKANFAAEKLGGKEFIARLVEFGAHNDPLVLKALANAAKLYGEDTLREGGIGEGQQNPQELDAEISRVQGQLLGMKSTDGAYQSVKLKYESLWRQKTKGR